MDMNTSGTYLDPILQDIDTINNDGSVPQSLDELQFDEELAALAESMGLPPAQQQQAQHQHHGVAYGQPFFRSHVPINWHAQSISPFDQTHALNLNAAQTQPSFLDMGVQQFNYIDPQLVPQPNALRSLPQSVTSTPTQVQSPESYSSPAQTLTTPSLPHQNSKPPSTKSSHHPSTTRHPKLPAKRSHSSPHTTAPTKPFPNGSGSAGSSGGDEDKRQRNSAASARFRAKRKMREEALQIETRKKMDGLGTLEERVRELERENRFLRGILTERHERARNSSDGEESGK